MRTYIHDRVLTKERPPPPHKRTTTPDAEEETEFEKSVVHGILGDGLSDFSLRLYLRNRVRPKHIMRIDHNGLTWISHL
jgi:hypothetical protein